MGEPKGHVVLYRKYRSRSFDEVVGQEHIVKPLQESVKSGRIAHAYLFTGPRGTGKTSIARIFANAINGFEYNDQLPIDIIEIDGASNRRIDEIRELKDRIHVAPVQAKYKVYIIDEVHMLTKEAFNALLKTLEEPPEHAVFILATTEVHKLPATIISRTQRYALHLHSKEEIVKHLKEVCNKESIKFEEEALRIIAKMGQGGMRDSLSLLDQVSSLGDVTTQNVSDSLGVAGQDSVLQLLSFVEVGTPKEIVAFLHEQRMNGFSGNQLAKQLIDAIRDKNDLDTQWLELIENLIAVPASMQPDIALEVALLKANLNFNPKAKLSADPPMPAGVDAKVVEQKPEKTQPQKPEEPEAKTEPEEAVKEVKEEKSRKQLARLDEKSWQEILQKIKAKNNALHAVMRMSKPEYENGELNLIFRFGFHEKQVESAKKLLIDSASEVIGTTITISSSVDKNLKLDNSQPASEEMTRPEETKVEANASAKNVMDAFGGGEVVNI